MAHHNTYSRWIAALILVLWLAPAVNAQVPRADVSASLDRETIFLGESVLLKIELQNPENDTRPDYAALHKDFVVMDTGMNSSLELTNGRRQLTVEHNVLLEPKATGEIVLPPLVVGNQTTPPLRLTVLERPQGTAPSDEDIFVEVEATPLDPYVHSQVRFTVRLFHAPPITEGALNNEPWPEGLVVQRVGDDRTKPQIINGKRYRVVERRFAVFPERSGPMQLPAVSFRGRVADPGGNSASLFSRGRRVSVSSEPISLNVRPEPAAFSGDLWIPAAEMTLEENWPNGEPDFAQGEPVTRRLTMQARGLLSVQLPELALPEIPGIKIYPDQPTTKTQYNNAGWTIASRDQTYALVPTESGTITLPEIRVPWWDVQADQERVAVIPAREIQVAASQSASVAPDLLSQIAPVDGSNPPSADAVGSASSFWPAVSALLALAWLVTAAGWWRSRSAGPAAVATQPSAQDEQRRASEKQWRAQLKAACDSHNAQDAAQALIGLARVAGGGQINSLQAVATVVTDSAAAEIIMNLDRSLYAPDATAWDGHAMGQAMKSIQFVNSRRSQTSAPVRAAGLPPLYTAIVLLAAGMAWMPAMARDCDATDGASQVLLTGATIHTVDAARPEAEAMVYSRCGRILEVGQAQDLKARYSQAREVDATGLTAVPGLIDAHGHIMNLGLGLLTADLRDTRSKSAVLKILEDFSQDLPADAWLLGRGWDQNDWPEKAFPSRADLDALFPDRPVWLIRIDGHAGWANSAALAEADRDFSGDWQPEGGQIQRDENGEATGIFVDRAMGTIHSQVPDWTEADRQRGLTLALDRLARVGITGVHDAGTSQNDLQRYLKAEQDGDLSLRVYAMADGDQALLDQLCRSGSVKTPMVSARSVKLYADGALGSRGAALLADYSDEPGNRGLLLQPAAALAAQVDRAMGCGLQVNTHAIGDRGNQVVLDVYEAALKRHTNNPGRHRVEHAQVVAPADFERFSALQLIASVQPTHATSDMYWATDRVGPQRILGAYAWQRMLKLAIPLALGSDFPVEKIDPMLGLFAAVTRQDTGGWPADGWYADQRLTRAQALHGFTLGAAFAAFAEGEVGSLEPGKLADFVLLGQDLMTVDAADIPAIKVMATVVGGKPVFVETKALEQHL